MLASTGAGIATKLGGGALASGVMATTFGTTGALTANLIKAEATGDFPEPKEYLIDSAAEGTGGGVGAVVKGPVQSAAAGVATEVMIKEAASAGEEAVKQSDNNEER